MTHAYPLADTALAQRLEQVAAIDLGGYVDAGRVSGIYPEATTLRVGGGTAAFISPDNVVNGSVGLGMAGPVAVEEIDRLVEFFELRGAVPIVEVCPLADPTLLEALARRDFRLSAFEAELYQPLPAPKQRRPAPGVRVRAAKTKAERATWAELAARGFGDDKPAEADRLVSRTVSSRMDALHFIGYLDGEPAGTGMLYIAEGVARFGGDATLPAMRGRGVQSAVLAARLRVAARAGCDLAVIGASPGSTSQRNQERAGFRVAYTRATFVRTAQP